MQISHPMEEKLYFTGVDLDRAHHLRSDPDWLDQRLNSADSVFVPVWRNRSLILEDKEPQAVYLMGGNAEALRGMSTQTVFLGLEGEQAFFGIDLPATKEAEAFPLPDGSKFADLRLAATDMDRNQAGMLAYARALSYWHGKHMFCGSCGAETLSRRGGHERKCSNADCARVHFPRTDPAVIMLVSRSGGGVEHALLAQGRRFKGIRFSTLAGFVEPGETLEDAVAREVMEESGIHVTDVQYQASQPWPFPASLMLGYRARATSTEIAVDETELVEARWFTVEEVKEMARAEPEGLPGKLSISRWLIDGWLRDNS